MSTKGMPSTLKRHSGCPSYSDRPATVLYLPSDIRDCLVLSDTRGCIVQSDTGGCLVPSDASGCLVHQLLEVVFYH